MGSVLTAENITYQAKKKFILESVSIELKQGEVVGVLGPNGAGKTSLFHILSGLILNHQGQIILDDQNLTRTPIHQRAQNGIVYLPQDPSIFRGLSVQDNIWAALELNKDLSDENKSDHLNHLLKAFNLTSLRSKHGALLSGGERRRVEIARCLALNPSFILFDEPFTGLDPMAIQITNQQINDLKNRNIGVLITDHNVQDTLKICDRIYILNQGSVLTSGSTESVIEHPEVKPIYLGNTLD